MIFRSINLIALFALLLMASAPVRAEMVMPYILASQSAGSVSSAVAEAKSKLAAAGFEVAGEYSPYAGTHIVVATSEVQKAHAAKTEHGGFGAAMRIAINQAGGDVQISYVNPEWMAHVYRMEGKGEALKAKLAAALGNQKLFGSAEGMDHERLRNYQYMIFMPDFEDPITLASYGSQKEALAAVEAGLAKGAGGTKKVYRVDLPGKAESVIGIALTQGDGADNKIMPVIDTTAMKQSAHLPYEVLVTEGKVIMLHGKFRIAQSFPDLAMGTFMEISSAPDAIEASLKAAAKM
uniref:Uncharacterized protein n=1 Tax=Magnetococcus massalia (strain MO-1) TaxID=451514 RepID=A0A1S7LF48_MAGMO|nr:conserved exported protein of unknown function [Candidatus Magnetococcus massalia]